MRKAVLLTCSLIFVLFSFAQPYTFTSTNFSGWPPMNWTSANTWIISGGTPAYNYPQTPDDIVIIEGIVLLDVNNLTVASIKVNYNTVSEQYGSLDIESNTISTIGDISLLTSGVGSGSLSVNSGTINSGGAFTFNKGSISLSSGTINIGDYFSHVDGTMTASAEVNINVATTGPRNDNVNPSIYYGSEAILTLNSSNIVLNLKDLNTGTAPEIYAGDFSTTGTGTVTLDINNTSNISNDNCHIVSDADFETLELNLNNDIATGNEIICETINAGVDFTIADLNLSNGLMYTIAATNLVITNSLSLNSTAELTVNGNFTSSGTDALGVDGILYTTGNLTLQSGNISGGGTVFADTYVVGSNTVYGILQENLTAASYFSASTWFGSANDNNWFNGVNWQTGSSPSASTDVTIWAGAGAGNMPVIGTSGANTKNLIISSNSSITINNGGNLTADGIQMINSAAADLIINGGAFTFLGTQMINHSASNLTMDGGTFSFNGQKFINSATGIINSSNSAQMTFTVSNILENLGQISLDNSQLIIYGNADMKSGSKLDIQNGSSVKLGQQE